MKFKEVANQIGGEYVFHAQKIKSLGGSNIASNAHEITLVYKSILITLIYDFGITNLAEIECVIKSRKALPEFSVATKNQIKRLFSRDKSPFKVKSSDPLLDSRILKCLVDSNYQTLANETQFEPEIQGSYREDMYRIYTKFYLGFEHKEMSILPSIDFYKMVIDEILRQ
ncbi:hypothetical protein [Crocinitomix catalasitica]|uniref:hypothetical protein n=1 Tax=Crocinitomix catalasitica TaxID=184607 RepID=UPI0012F70AD2|nr:hypothetical protein [Crocinitomix catalasitica]